MALDLRVASPCHEKWDSMTGDERKRFCAKCQLHVHNVSALSEAEVVKLFEAETGRVCGRLYRRADGTVLLRDCPVGLAKVRRRLAVALTTAAAMVVAAVGLKPARAASCDTGGDDSLKGLVQARFVDAKEWLRETETFGPLVNRLDPLPPPSTHVMGKMVLIPPKPPGAP